MFKKAMSALIIASHLCWAVGCTHTRMITQKEEVKLFDKIYQTSRGKIGHIVLSNGQRFDGYNILVSQSKTSWLVPDTHEEKTVPTADIREITFKNTGRGALQGLGLGFVGGAVTGALAASSDPGTGFVFSRAEVALLAGVIFGLAGGAVGITLGGAIGSKDSFDFRNRVHRSSEK